MKTVMQGLEHKQFYIPTIPLWWFLAASMLPGKALAVGCQLWFVYAVNKRKSPFKFSWQYLKVRRPVRRRALVALEKSGLITVKRLDGKAPLVTITLDQKKVPEVRGRYELNRKIQKSRTAPRGDRSKTYSKTQNGRDLLQ
jgi:hypothetical protein